MFIQRQLCFPDNLNIFEILSVPQRDYYPMTLSLTLPISHLLGAQIPLFAISVSVEYKCQECHLVPGTVVAETKPLHQSGIVLAIFFPC